MKILINPSQTDIDTFVASCHTHVGIDTETDSLDTITASLKTLQLYNGSDTVLIFTRSIPVPIKHLIESLVCIGHNIKYDYGILAERGVCMNHIFDTMVAESVLTSGTMQRVNLAETAKRRVGVVMDKGQQKSFINHQGDFTQSQIDYMVMDVVHLHSIMAAQLSAAADTDKQYGSNLVDVISLENRTVIATAKMERNGWLVDTVQLEELTAEAKKKALLALRGVDALAGGARQINLFGTLMAETPEIEYARLRNQHGLESADKVISLLGAHGVAVDNAQRATLRSVQKYGDGTASTLAGHIADYGEAAHQLSTSLAPIAASIHEKTGRIHPAYWQVPVFGDGGAITGRFSCKNPNMQNVPRNKQFRQMFVARQGTEIVTADFASVEIRIAGNLSLEPAYIDFFSNSNNTDFHGYMAAQVFDVPLEDVCKVTLPDGTETAPKLGHLRSIAKIINFQLLYGVTKYGLSRSIGCTEDEAEDFIGKYHQRFPRLMAYLRRQSEQATRFGYITDGTIGRMRHFRNRRDSSTAREAQNFPVQSTNASQTKLALCLISERTPYTTIGTVHDEIIVEVPADKAYDAGQEIRKLMIEAANEVLSGPIPYEVGVSINDHWTK